MYLYLSLHTSCVYFGLFVYVILYTYHMVLVGCKKKLVKKTAQQKSSINAGKSTGAPLAGPYSTPNGSSGNIVSLDKWQLQLAIDRSCGSYDSTNLICRSGSEMETNHKTCLLSIHGIYIKTYLYTSDVRNLQWLFAVPYWYIFGTMLPVVNFFR